MKFLALFFWSAAFCLGAFAPDSISGMIYRESTAPTGARGVGESTIHFFADERYLYVSAASANFISEPAAGGRVILRQPPSGGRYAYHKTGDASATLQLIPDAGGAVLPRTLTFTGPNHGGTAEDPRVPRFWFHFTDAFGLNSAPAVNISTRGHVSNGRSLVVGFVVPGTSAPVSTFVPPPGTPQREVLVRVVGGASLRSFGISDGWADPDFELFASGSIARTTEFKYSDWNLINYPLGGFSANPSPGVVSALKHIFSFVGAFPLADNSRDAVGFFRLLPGAYTIVAAPKAGDTGGEVIIEVFFLP